MNAKYHFRIASFLVKLLDNQFKVFGVRFGIDPLLGLIPGLGDFISFLLSTYIIWIGVNMGLSKEKIAEMLRNIIFDLLLGLVPIVGDVSDFIYKANTKNLKILREFRKVTPIEGQIIE